MKILVTISFLTLLTGCTTFNPEHRSPTGLFVNESGYNQYAEIKIAKDGHYIRTHSFSFGVPMTIDGEEHNGWTNFEIGTWNYSNGTINLNPTSQQLENEDVGKDRFDSSRSLQVTRIGRKLSLVHEGEEVILIYKKK